MSTEGIVLRQTGQFEMGKLSMIPFVCASRSSEALNEKTKWCSRLERGSGTIAKRKGLVSQNSFENTASSAPSSWFGQFLF